MPLSSYALRRALRLSVWDGVFAGLFANLTGGVFLVGYALTLKASEVQIGLLSAFPLLANISQPFSTYLIERVGRRRPLALLGGGFARGIWLVLLVAPLFLSSPPTLIAFSILIVGLSQAGTAVNNLAWLSWMADLVPEEIRGRYFGLRNMALGIAALAATLIGGYTLDLWQVAAPGKELVALQGLFLTGVLFGLVSLTIQTRIPEPPFTEGDGSRPFHKRLRLPFQEPNFRRLLLFAMVWNFGVYFAVYMLKELKLSYTVVTIYVVLSSFADLASARAWGRFADRETNKPVLWLASFFAALIPAGWLLTDPSTIILLGLLHMQGGFFWAGIRLCTNNLLLKISPSAHRSIFLSTFNLVSGLTAVISPILGGLAAQHLPTLLSTAEVSLSPLKVLFLVSFLLRLPSLALLARVVEPQERSLWQAVPVIRNVRAFTTTMGFNPLYHFWLRGKKTAEREQKTGVAK
jgi:MFS family permease